MYSLCLRRYEENVPVGKVGPDDVALKVLASPINPADLNFVSALGVY
jgi:NADPH:quinone reductase-like Zn-dependent oxidoreductase